MKQFMEQYFVWPCSAVECEAIPMSPAITHAAGHVSRRIEVYFRDIGSALAGYCNVYRNRKGKIV